MRKFDDRFDKQVTLEDTDIPESLYEFIQHHEQIEAIQTILTDLRANVGYVEYVKKSKKERKNAKQNEDTKAKQIEALIEYFKDHECYEGATHLEQALILMPQPSIQIGLEPLAHGTSLKTKLEQTLEDHEFNRIPKLITAINKAL